MRAPAFASPKGRTESITLVIAAGIYNVTTATCGGGCINCCGDSNFGISPNPILCPIGETMPCSSTAVDCHGYSVFPSSWSSSNTAVMTVNSSGQVTGVAVGSATITATFLSATVYTGQMCGGNGCPTASPAPTDPGTVKPTISGPNTLWWFNGLGAGVSGYTNQITLTASSGGTGTSYQWAITVGSGKVSLSTSTSATVQVTSIGQSTQANDVSITVTVGGITSDPFMLTVRAPYTFGTDSAHPQPAYASDNTYVWRTDVYNIVLDNFLTALPTSINVNENWTTAVVPDYSGTNWRRSAPNPFGCPTIQNAELDDTIQGEVPSRIPTPVYNVNQNGTAVQHWGQEWRIGTCNTGFGPRVETNTLQKYTDHAAYTGVTTPAP